MKSIAGARLLGFAQGLAPLRAWAPQRPVHPPASLGLPALDPHIVALRPHAGLEDQREAGAREEDAARTWNWPDDKGEQE